MTGHGAQGADQSTTETRATTGIRARKVWWRRPWIGPMTMVAVAFLVFTLPRYVGLDPTQSLIPPKEGYPWHYPLLVAHIFLGSVALVATCLQVWPWLRTRYPVVHRWSGRAYLFAGVFPASVLTLAIAPLTAQGLPTASADIVLALLWLFAGVAGFRAARQRRYGDHRRWMVRGVALTWAIITDRVWMVIWLGVLTPTVPTWYGGDTALMIRDMSAVSIWMAIFGNLLFAEWWLQRRRGPRRNPGGRPAVAPERVTVGA